ncbi:MAG TPA: SDR family oxidoreductase [Myxococcales bacterium]|nr:SDR family oxidoreductase [Myxococcales bacterium]HIM00064.1 SDR family oxidoreductase [Myxococcales bacterium]
MARISKLSRSIKDKVALVTGAASGMGRATAHLFADEGAKVAVSDLDADAVEAVVSDIRGAGGTAVGFVLDVSRLEEIERVVSEVAAEFGGLDILVNNAGISRPAPVEGENFEVEWEHTIAVNLTAHARLIRASLPHLEKDGTGRVINIASTEGVGAQPFVSAYTASKHGVVGLTRAMAVELGKRGVTFNCVCPGPIHTGMTAPIPDAAKEKFARRRVPLKRYGEPEEVAHATLNFALPASSFMNGAVLLVDGGLSIQNN